MMDMEKFREVPLLGILRGVEMPLIEELTQTIISSGMTTVEITMNTPDAASLIKKMSEISGNRLNIGAGTVLSMKDLEAAMHAGASFIVMPCCIPEIMQHCRQNKIPVFPGALSPHEIHNAWNQGATMIKVFPSSLFGPEYFKKLQGPFNDIQLMAVGGVKLENIADYFESGAKAVAVGTSVFELKLMHAGVFHGIKNSLTSLVSRVKQVKARL